MAKGTNSTITKLPPAADEGVSDRARKELDVRKAVQWLGKGGRSKRHELDNETPVIRRLSLRLDEELAERIGRAARARPVRTSSHSWIVEAVLEKLQKESF